MKRIIFAALLFLMALNSCSKEETRRDPIVPQGEVTREFLSKIRVGKDGNFQYWNQDSPALSELKHFVSIVTDPNCKGYVPPKDRIATFDVDGTLLCETAPYYFNWMLFLHRYLHDPSFTPSKKEREWAEKVEQYVYENRSSEKDWGQIQQELQAKGFRGMTGTQFSDYVSSFINSTNVTGLTNLKWGCALYWPMIEVVSYLVANDFVVFLCSGVDRDICRTICDGIYDIMPYHMISSDVNYVLEHQDGWEEFVNSEDYKYIIGEKVLRGDFLQLGTAINKIVKIRREIGQQPILSWGNSSGDFPMFHYTNIDNKYPHISFCLICDDYNRELGNPDKAASCWKECQLNGWVPVSMAYEWWTIYGPAVTRE